MVADTAEKFVENLIVQGVIYRYERMLLEVEAQCAARLPRPIVAHHKDCAAAIHNFTDVGYVDEVHSTHQLLVTYACRAYHIDNLLGQITIRAVADCR